jgi:hypothetical protein
VNPRVCEPTRRPSEARELGCEAADQRQSEPTLGGVLDNLEVAGEIPVGHVLARQPILPIPGRGEVIDERVAEQLARDGRLAKPLARLAERPPCLISSAKGAQLRQCHWAVGCWLSAVGCRLSAVGCRLLAVGCRLSAVGCRLSAVGRTPSAYSFQRTAHSEQLTANSPSRTTFVLYSAFGIRHSAFGFRHSAFANHINSAY